mmetsp:Transcript_10772/g.15567  ORF Transcript_10772/g.15567 Transcript_10772/m.15567 type:complete len:99 (+) Transcript_10772:305-601(+)
MDPPAAIPPVNNWEGNPLKEAFIRLGLTDVAAREFMENGVTDMERFRSLDSKAQDHYARSRWWRRAYYPIHGARIYPGDAVLDSSPIFSGANLSGTGF